MAIRCDATSDGLSATTNLPTITSFTMMCWFYSVADRNDYTGILSFGDSGSDAFYNSGHHNTDNSLTAWNGTDYEYGVSLSTSTWYHLCIVCDGTGINNYRVYLNGSLAYDLGGNASCSAETMWVGRTRYTGEYINGRIAHVKVYNAALTVPEIQQEMYSAQPVRLANLNRWSPLWSASDYADYSGNGYSWTENGTLTTEDGPPVSWGAPVWAVGNPPAQVESAGTASIVQSTVEASSTTITVPADTDVAVLCAIGYRNLTGWFLWGGTGEGASINSVAFTEVQTTDNQISNGHVWIGYLANPSTGSQTFAWDNNGPPGEGVTYVITYWKNVDTANPIVSSGKNTTGDDVTGLSAASTNMIVGCMYDYNATPTATGDGQTSVTNGTYNSAGYAVAYELGDGDWYGVGSSGYSTAAALVLRALGVDAGGGAEYTLTAAQGSYTYTGQASSLIADRDITAAQGTYTYTGQAAGLRRNYPLVAAQGTYTYTGQAAGLVADYVISAAQGTYTYTGQAVTLNKGFYLTAAQGTYTYTGQATALIADRVLTAAQGTYTYTGYDVTLTHGGVGYELTAEMGSYTVTGQAAALQIARVLAAAQGSYTLTGQAAGLLAARLIAAGQGTYTLTGQDTALIHDLVLTAAQGTYTYTGQSTTLKADRKLTAAQGSYVLTGQAAGLDRIYVLIASRGTYAVTGKNANLVYSGIGPATDARIYVVSADNRVYIIVDEDRTLEVSSDTRTMEILQ